MDQTLVTVFVAQAKTELAKEDSRVFTFSGIPCSWAYWYTCKPEGMSWTEFYSYNELVGERLVNAGVLESGKPGRPSCHVGVSRTWYEGTRE